MGWVVGVRGYVKAEERELCLHKLEVIQARERGDNHDLGGLWPCRQYLPYKKMWWLQHGLPLV